MNDFISSSLFFGPVITIFFFTLGDYLQKKTGKKIINPILFAVVFVGLTLIFLNIDYESYYESTFLINALLPPATVSLAVPLYKEINALRKNPLAIILGIISGVITNFVTIYILSLLFRLDHTEYVTLLPKSVTTAIGMPLSKEMGGYEALTVVAIIITGIFGNIIAGGFSKILRIRSPKAVGVAIGTSSHAIGTTKAFEIGSVEGALSSLSLTLSGILTIVFVGLFSSLI